MTKTLASSKQPKPWVLQTTKTLASSKQPQNAQRLPRSQGFQNVSTLASPNNQNPGFFKATSKCSPFPKKPGFSARGFQRN
jgi:hypothetical protein